ncbi:SGNH/GDSL hydrolase family protein [Kribbella sp. NPDC055071]
MRPRLLNLVIAFALLFFGAAGDSAPQPLVTPSGQLSVVALGDSVTSGYHCYCRAFPALYGDLLQQRTGTGVTVHNLGRPGLDSSGLLEEVDDDNSLTARATAAADVVLITIGANDFVDHEKDITSGRCTTECVTTELSGLTTNLQRILQRIRAFRPADPPTVLITDYWNVFKDGAVARGLYPPAGVEASQQLTLVVNQLIKSAATDDGSVFVDLYAPFEAQDDTSILASDGDHPNAAGHALIANLIAANAPTAITIHQGP